MGGASIKTTLELWASSLRDVKARVRSLFTQERVAASAGLFLDGLLGEERRKTGWMRAEAAGDPGPWRQQAILGRGRWNADDLRDVVRDYVLETLADDDAVLVIDETGFLKQGKASCGVGRQYTGSAGKITNCQIGVFACYVSRHGHAFIDRALYLPKAWTDDPARMAAAHVPDKTGFATKPALACTMIERVLSAQVPFSWVAADSVYGVGAVETALRRSGKGYVLGVSSGHSFNSWGKSRCVAGTAVAIAQNLPASDWTRLSAGEGTKGPRLSDWAYLELADLDAADYDASRPGLSERLPLTINVRFLLGAVECLDLAFLVDGQHDGVGRRIDIEADDIVQLVDELRIIGELELPPAVRLQPVRLPDAPDRAGADTGGLGHHVGCPVCGLAWRTCQCQRHHALGNFGTERGNARGARLVAQQPRKACLGEALLPAPDAGLGLAGLVHDLIGAEPVCAQQDDLSPPHLLLRHIAIPHERLQTETVGRSNDDGNTRSHAPDSHAIGSSGIPQGIQMSDLIH